MPEKSTEVGQDIKIPMVTGPASAAGDEDLVNMQNELFNKSEKSNEQEPQKKQVKIKNRAEDIIKKTQATAQNLKNDKDKSVEKPLTKEQEFTDTIPEFDASQFLLDAETKPEEKIIEDVIPGGDEEEAEEDVDLSKEGNLKNLRKIAGNFKQERDSAKAEIEKLQTELTNRPDAKKIETEVATLKSRIQELEKYEYVFGLENNPLFKERYVETANNVIAEMKKIATDYGFGEEVVEELLSINNRKELDETLEESFSSSSARNDLKTLKQKYDGIQKDRQEFEKKPKEALAKFQSEQAQSEAEINRKRDIHLQSVTQDGWVAALSVAAEASRESKIYELIEQPGKKDHNEKVVRPTLGNAQKMLQTGVDYIEKLVRSKAVMSPSFVQWFAQICQQAAATQMVNHVRWGIYDKYNALSKQQNKQNGYERPGVASQARIATALKSDKKKSGQEIAADIWEEVTADK